MVITEQTIVNFWNKVSKDSEDKCWEWNAAKNKKGYGSFWIPSEKMMRHAHRISYIISKGSIPDGLFVLHSCDNPSCVNPQHLSIGNNQDNMSDMKSKGRHVSWQLKKTHCPRNHEYNFENTYIDKQNKRHCKECFRIRQRGYYQDKKSY